ncbi:MAG: phosphate/phosphite/phosphonate ABC transporter substrate-binding protein [Deltaproteobacteria bacterium]|nr:phosphate/phosphite/phosphonate ABC transporter substrate-binding protein [Deltaproteobacteria bacterium]
MRSVLKSVLIARHRVWGAFFLAFLIAAPATAGFPENSGNRTIRFGVIPRFNPHVMYEYYQPLMDYLSRNTPYRFELRIGRSYMETIEDLRKGVTDVAYLGGATYALARHRFGARALVKPLNAQGKSAYRCNIIVRSDSPVRKLSDLKGRSFAFGARRSTTGSLIPTIMLCEAGVTPDKLGRRKNLRNHEEVARAVLKGVFEAGAVKDVVAWKYKDQGLRVVAVSEELPNAPIAAGPSLSMDAEKALTGALLSIDETKERGRSGSEGLGPEIRGGFVTAHGEEYDFLYRKITSITGAGGCGIRCHSSNPFLK